MATLRTRARFCATRSARQGQRGPLSRASLIADNLCWWVNHTDASTASDERLSNELSTDRSLSAPVRALFFSGRTGASLYRGTEGWDEGESAPIPGFDSPTHAVQEPARMGDEGKAARRGGAGGFAV
jgi:hypothetical protein